MNIHYLISALVLGIGTNSANAAAPVWTFNPSTPTTVSVARGETKSVKYTVTNQSPRSHTLVMKPIAGVKQVQEKPGDCKNVFTLSHKGASCTLNLLITANEVTQPISEGPIVCQQGSSLQCYRPNASHILRVIILPAKLTTTLSVPTRGTIPVATSRAIFNSITVTNTGAYTAHNVRAILPAEWTAVSQDASDCRTILSHGTCTLNFSSYLAYIAKGNIKISGDNITNPPSMAFAFTARGYLVFNIDNGIMQVIDNSDLSSSHSWGASNNITNAQDPKNGQANTDLIPHNDRYAAGACYNSDGGGGTWYLPAICQMGSFRQNCTGDNIEHLHRLGFGGLSGKYWSSTESSGQNGEQPPQFDAWVQHYNPTLSNIQDQFDKTNLFKIRCARVVPNEA